MKNITVKTNNEKISFIDSIKDLINNFDYEDLSKIKIYESEVKLVDFLQNSTSELSKLNSKVFWDSEILDKWKKLTGMETVPKKFESRENLKTSGFFLSLIHLYDSIVCKKNYVSPEYCTRELLTLYSASYERKLPKFIQEAKNQYDWLSLGYHQFYGLLRKNAELVEFLTSIAKVNAVKIQLHLYYDPTERLLLCSEQRIRNKFVKVSTLTFSESNQKNYYSKSMKNYLDSKNKEEFLVSLIKDSLNSFYQKQLEIGIKSEVRMSDFIAGKALFSFVSSDDEVKEWMSKTNSKILKDSFKRLSTDSERDRFKRILDSYLTD